VVGLGEEGWTGGKRSVEVPAGEKENEEGGERGRIAESKKGNLKPGAAWGHM